MKIAYRVQRGVCFDDVPLAGVFAARGNLWVRAFPPECHPVERCAVCLVTGDIAWWSSNEPIECVYPDACLALEE